ncbi:MAG TPA: hypothetical protein VJS13_02015 [Pyrinomonadaceae bacterium]|nr:hypothetical protein [Pyrinomonadaceae bacterium]
MRLILIGVISVICGFNPNATAKREFKFQNVPSPVANDAASTARLTLIDGNLDNGSAELNALIDGRLPTDEDEPGANVYFNAGSSGGRFRMDLGHVIEIAQVHSYSWHPSSRGPQLYKLYAADGSEENLDLNPKRGVDPATRGWKFITTVNTLPQQGEDGGQYGVSVTDSSGSLGKYRYLLFDCYVTELYDNWGNTFYSEIDVISKPHTP